MSEQAKNDTDLSERLHEVLGEPFQGVAKKFEECGFQLKGVELEPGEIILKFQGGQVDCNIYKLLLDKLNRISIGVKLCFAGDTPLACVDLTIAVSRQA
jgi:hypothetical protein